MRRQKTKYKKIKDPIKQVFIRFFWTQCKECGDEVKKEYMWVIHRPFYSITDPERFTSMAYCTSCVRTKQDAQKVYKDLDKKSMLGACMSSM